MATKTKAIIISLAVLAALVLVFFFWQNPLKKQSEEYTATNIFSANLDNLQKIEIGKDGQTTVLEKADNNWVISSDNNAPANADAINKLLDGLKQLKTGTIISRNPDKLALFGLSQEMATDIKLIDSQANILFNLMIGKAGPQYNQCYIKKSESAEIILADTNLNLLMDPAGWKAVEQKNSEEQK